MKKGIACSLLLYLSFTSLIWAQPFQNLDFESANLVSVPTDPYNRDYFDLAFPGWSGFTGTNQLNAVLHDGIFLDSAGISIFDANPSFLIDGSYTVLLQSGNPLLGSSATNVNASISQTALVPVGTKSLTFLARPIGPFSVSLGGSNLTLISFPVANQNYSLYEADISTFAGLTEALTFTALAQPIHANDGWLYLDDIQFSPTVIPEPSTMSILIVGVLGLFFWQRTHRKTA